MSKKESIVKRMGLKLKLAQPEDISQNDTSPFPFLDASGKLSFEGKAILHQQGVDFSNGKSFKITMKELHILEELGKGQYGIVLKVLHSPTNITMALKQIRLDISDIGMKQILMELDVLHKNTCPYIVDFYGAFYSEGRVYYCMEYMDAGSLDRLCYNGIPEDVLSRIAKAMTCALFYMKESLQIMHRDVKPTNVLINLQGEVKLCDFGVSGKLVQSLAQTHVGCQNYMAPERIASTEATPYSVQSDIWSLGLSLFEVVTGEFPYGKFDNMFAQLSAVVEGPVPVLPAHKYSEELRDFINCCLEKNPTRRPTFQQLLGHRFIRKYDDIPVDMSGWARKAVESSLKKKRWLDGKFK